MGIYSFIANYNYRGPIALVGMCSILRVAYPVMDRCLQYNEKYNLLPLERRKYIIKNFIKATMLVVVTIMSFRSIILPALVADTWNSRIIHVVGAVYTSNDVMGLLMVPKLPYSTKMHHIVTTTLCVTSFGIDFQSSSLGKMMFVYTLASANAYLVNFYLGARLLTEKAKLEAVRISARNIYFLCCTLNWGWHIIWSVLHYDILHMGHLIYFLMLLWIIKDDIILLSWLNNTMIKF